ncbi:uncharacterized protein MYCFIDRAFT_177595 [Pseudocercospora fijiensis CIRAD86]|uniref:Uncharacterized protein n=1 Tax=Pseudocercospora fijiensis (strain CIRAD86) TaxID=383855 RepID=M2ZNJ3_PSEFD|nr:uncharacterized protein MYCFIDRAFT_177595 [Pseudocercospora fijiensis CIRAD86]EME80664.1 hypothetical protein MYCFIDRAFT_177595 [Pseudocercospora fijiensis CIRAD86]
MYTQPPNHSPRQSPDEKTKWPRLESHNWRWFEATIWSAPFPASHKNQMSMRRLLNSTARTHERKEQSQTGEADAMATSFSRLGGGGISFHIRSVINNQLNSAPAIVLAGRGRSTQVASSDLFDNGGRHSNESCPLTVHGNPRQLTRFACGRHQDTTAHAVSFPETSFSGILQDVRIWRKPSYGALRRFRRTQAEKKAGVVPRNIYICEGDDAGENPRDVGGLIDIEDRRGWTDATPEGGDPRLEGLREREANDKGGLLPAGKACLSPACSLSTTSHRVRIPQQVRSCHECRKCFLHLAYFRRDPLGIDRDVCIVYARWRRTGDARRFIDMLPTAKERCRLSLVPAQKSRFEIFKRETKKEETKKIFGDEKIFHIFKFRNRHGVGPADLTTV